MGTMDTGKILKQILLWSFALFFSFAANGLNWAAHCHNNSCMSTTIFDSSATLTDRYAQGTLNDRLDDCCEHFEDKQATADCHYHRLTVDNTIVSSQSNIVPDTKCVWLSDFYFTNTGRDAACPISTAGVFSSSPETKVANRDLLAAVSCLVI